MKSQHDSKVHYTTVVEVKPLHQTFPPQASHTKIQVIGSVVLLFSVAYAIQ